MTERPGEPAAPTRLVYLGASAPGEWYSGLRTEPDKIDGWSAARSQVLSVAMTGALTELREATWTVLGRWEIRLVNQTVTLPLNPDRYWNDLEECSGIVQELLGDQSAS